MKIKELFIILIIATINITIAYCITTLLGIQNIILYQTITAIQYTITYEVLIFMALSFIESLVYHYKFEI